MAAKFKRPILIVNSVAAGRTATLQVPTGRRINKVVLHVSDTGHVANQIIDKIRVKAGTKVQRTMTCDELHSEYLRMGANGDTSYGILNNNAGSQIDIPIWFIEPWRKGLQHQRALGWCTGDLPDGGLIIELDINAAATAAVSVTATVEWDNPVYTADDARNNSIPPGAQIGDPMFMGAITKWYEEDISITGLTKTYPLTKADSLQSIALYDSYVTKVELVVGDVTVREVLTQENNSDLTGKGMTSVSTIFALELDDDDDLLSAIPLAGAKNAYIKLTLSDATPRNIRAIIQRIGPRD